MKKVTQMSSDERKAAFTVFLNDHVKSAQKYINDLERGFAEAPIKKYSSIFEITSVELLENPDATKAIKESSAFSRASIGGTPGLAGLNWYIRFLKDSRDSYYDFMHHFGIKPKDLFDWGMKAIIFPTKGLVDAEWETLKKRVLSGDEVYIRGYGRDAHGTQLCIDFYNFFLKNNNVKKDPSNNYRPQEIMKNLTDLTRNKDIYNYQVSHIWGRTKNIFLFEAPWNICYTPKIIDPFTGHETKGDLPEEFQKFFLKYAQKKYRKYIDDYNQIISSYDIVSCLKDYCKMNDISDDRFIHDMAVELSPIPIV